MQLGLVDVTGRPQYQSVAIQKNTSSQKASWLQKDIEKKAEVADEVVVQAFAAFYFIAKEEISNMKVLPII